MYHLVDKRSPVSPAKKASASLEKKFPAKEGIAYHLDKMKVDFKNATAENSTMPYNSSAVGASTIETNVESDMHNVSTTSTTPVSILNSTVTSSTTSTVSSTSSSSPYPSSTSPAVPTVSSSTTSKVSSPTPSVTYGDEYITPTKPSNITNTTVSCFLFLHGSI